MMKNNARYRLTPQELATRRAYENRTPAQRLVALEAGVPSQRRPPKMKSIWDRVDFLEWDRLGIWCPLLRRRV